MATRTFDPDQAVVTILVYPELEEPEGHFASGDDEFDKKTVAEIRRELEDGNQWAWCTVGVQVSWAGFDEQEYLGACSYKDLEQFKQCGYMHDMVGEALDKLTTKIRKEGWGLEVPSNAEVALQNKALELQEVSFREFGA